MDKPRPNDQVAPGRRKKPYRMPRLVEYGDLQRITMAKGSNRGDGALPATRK